MGVLYEICKSERSALDEAEFLGLGYDRREVIVDSANFSQLVRAETYVALHDAIDESLVPYDWYKALVASGAREHGIVDEYVASIADHPMVVDPDHRRRAYHFRLTQGMDQRPPPSRRS